MNLNECESLYEEDKLSEYTSDEDCEMKSIQSEITVHSRISPEANNTHWK